MARSSFSTHEHGHLLNTGITQNKVCACLVEFEVVRVDFACEAAPVAESTDNVTLRVCSSAQKPTSAFTFTFPNIALTAQKTTSYFLYGKYIFHHAEDNFPFHVAKYIYFTIQKTVIILYLANIYFIMQKKISISFRQIILLLRRRVKIPPS